MALPHFAYGDPARIVESNELHAMGCNACARAELILGKPMCSNNKKYPACKQDKKNGYKLAAHAGGEK